MLHSKFVASNLVKAAMIALLILSCIPFVGCGKDVNSLIQKLKDKDSDVRGWAAEALGKIKDARAVEPLIAALKDKDSGVRMYAAEALGVIKDDRAVEPLIAELKDANRDVRWYAAMALGRIKDDRAVEPLIAALKDEDSDVRMYAAEALGKIGAPAVEPLIAALKDDDIDVRQDAARALGEIKDARAVEPLIAALKDEDKYVRRGAANALENIGEPSLIKALKDSKRAVNTLVESLVCWDFSAAKMLSRLGWMPESDSDRIHFWVGLRSGEKLKENWNTTKDVLLKDVKSNNYCTIENALYAFIATVKEEIIPELIEKLNTKGDKTMAEAYLNCGHSKLADAAKGWAWKHGYSISTGSGNAPVSWGHW